MKTKQKVISTKTRTETDARSSSPSPSSSSMEKTRKCFLCAKEFQSTESKRNSRLSITESSFMLNEIFELPPGDLTQDEYMLRLKFQSVCYCSQCLKIILNVSALASELEILKEELETEKINVVMKLKESFEKVSGKKGALVGKLQELRREIVEEIDKSRRENENSLQSRKDLSKTLSKDSLLKPYPYKRRRTESIPSKDSKPKSGNDDLPTSNSSLHHLEADTDKNDTVADKKTKQRRKSLKQHQESLKQSPNISRTALMRKKQKASSVDNVKSKMRSRVTPYHEPKTCEECGQVLSNARRLKDHRLAIHGRTTEYKCEICNFTGPSPNKVKIHMASFHPHECFKCDLCEQSCSTKQSLQRHKKCHDGYTPYKCKLCPGRFKNQMSLTVHIKFGDCQNKSTK